MKDPRGLPAPDHGPRILGVTIGFAAMSGVTVAARIMAGLSYMAGKRASWDDWLITFAWVRSSY